MSNVDKVIEELKATEFTCDCDDCREKSFEVVRTVLHSLLNEKAAEIEAMKMPWVGGEAEQHIQIADGYNKAVREIAEFIRDSSKQMK